MNTEEVKAIFGENFEDEDEDFDMVNMIKDTYQVYPLLWTALLAPTNQNVRYSSTITL